MWLRFFVDKRGAHVKAINDYLLLYDSMTNKQCRDFLHLSSINLCTRMLRELKLPSLGSGKHKIYYRKEDTDTAVKIKRILKRADVVITAMPFL